MIRCAQNQDKKGIAALLTGSIMRDFAIADNERARIMALIEDSLHTALFLVSEREGVVQGAAAIIDGRERMIKVDAGAARRHFGPIMGTLIARALKKEFSPRTDLSSNVWFIDALVADDPFDAEALLNQVKSSLPGMTIKAEITDKNTAMLAAYKRQGFEEVARKPFTGVKDTGIKEQIMLAYAG